MTSLSIRNNRIFGIGIPPKLWRICRALPGSRVSKTGIWTWPATPTAAREVVNALRQHGLRDTEADLGVVQLYQQSRASTRAEKFRYAENLLDHPTLTPSWLHQKQAYNFGYNQAGFGLYADLGCGKSKITVDLFANREHRLGLIIGPKRALGIWPREFDTHSIRDVRTLVLRDIPFKARVALIRQAYEQYRLDNQPLVIVTNYAAVSAPQADELRNLFLEIPWDIVVLDEAHRIATPGSKQSWFLGQLADQVPYRMALTGTPLRNGPFSAYALYRFLDKGVFGTRFSGTFDKKTGQWRPGFRDRYAIMHPRIKGKVVEYINMDEFHEKLYSIAFRVTQDVLDLPDEQTIVQPVLMNDAARRAHTQMKRDHVTHGVVADNVLVQILRLQQITSGFLPDPNSDGVLRKIDDSKHHALDELLDDIDPKEPVVVFARFIEDLNALQFCADAAGRRYGEVSGRRSDLTRDAKIPDNVDLLAVQIQAGGEGVDFTRARYGIFYSIDPSITAMTQAHGRLRRPGQTRPVVFYYLVSEGDDETIDQVMIRGIREKQDLVQYILDEWNLEENDNGI